MKRMPKQQIVRRRIVDSTGSYVVSYLPRRKIEIKLPGTKHVVIVGPIRSRKNTGTRTPERASYMQCVSVLRSSLEALAS